MTPSRPAEAENVPSREAAIDAVFRDSRQISEVIPPSPADPAPVPLELQEVTDPRELEEVERLYERMD